MNDIDDSKITACGVLLISNDNQILAFARKGNTDQLGIPAGKRNEDESLKECAARELFEETGVEVDLSNISEEFCYMPDDKQRDGKNEYCTSYIVRSDKLASEYELMEANKDDEGNIEGFGIWVTPEEFIQSARSAYLDYNTHLLQYAGLIS